MVIHFIQKIFLKYIQFFIKVYLYFDFILLTVGYIMHFREHIIIHLPRLATINLHFPPQYFSNPFKKLYHFSHVLKRFLAMQFGGNGTLSPNLKITICVIFHKGLKTSKSLVNP